MLQIVTEFNRVLHSVMSVTECYTVLQSVTQCDRV